MKIRDLIKRRVKISTLINKGLGHMSEKDILTFVKLRKEWDDAHWALVRETANDEGDIDPEDPRSYEPQNIRTEAQKACESFFAALAPEQRFELLAVYCFRNSRHDEKDGWKTAVREAEKDWDKHRDGERLLPSTEDAAQETLIACVPDFAAIERAVSVLKERNLIPAD